MLVSVALVGSWLGWLELDGRSVMSSVRYTLQAETVPLQDFNQLLLPPGLKELLEWLIAFRCTVITLCILVHSRQCIHDYGNLVIGRLYTSS